MNKSKFFIIFLFLSFSSFALSYSEIQSKVIEKGGVILIVILILSVLGIFLCFYNFINLRGENIFPRKDVNTINLFIKDKKFSEVHKYCNKSSSMLSKICSEVFSKLPNNERLDRENIKELFEQEGEKAIENQSQKIKYIFDIATIAPMLGLLGTVLGMYEAFSEVDEKLDIKTNILAGGIVKALITTAAGLALGITLTTIHSIIQSKFNKLMKELESKTSSIFRSIFS